MFWFNLLGVLTAIIVVTITYWKWSFQYWKRKNVPFIKPKIPFGSLDNPIMPKKHFGIALKDMCDQIKPTKAKYFGIYRIFTPLLVLLDLDLVKNILTKDFQNFANRGIYHNEKDDPLNANLVRIEGMKWKNLRAKLTPTFTSGKLRTMFQIFVDCGAKLEETIPKKYNNNPVDIKDILGCFTTDIIGSCAFGLECNSFKEENSPFRVYGKKIFDRRSLIKNLLVLNFPLIAKALHIKLVHKDVEQFFMKVVQDAVDYREKNNVIRNDFFQLLIGMKNKKLENENENTDGKCLTFNEVAAQSFLFFLAGFETSSTTMTFVLYLLSKHQDIQEKVRKEIEIVLGKHNNQISYDSIKELKYMEQVINETLRMYSPVSILRRVCNQNYQIPDSSVVIEKNTVIFIPVYAIHHDPNYYPNPEKFDPERFSEKNKQSRHPFSFLPFGEGPRNCIGMRFGLMQSKVGLTVLLKNYKFSVHSKTEEPLEMSTKSVIFSAKGGIWLNIEKI